MCRAFAEGMFEWCARLAIRCAEFVESRGYLRAWATTADLGARAASRLPPGGTRSELLARSRLNLAAATDAQGGTGEAIGSRESALRSIRALARIGLLHLDEGDAVKAELPSAVCTELITADGRRQWRDHVGAATEQLRAEVLGVVEDLAGRLRS
ncbi:MULTISPECIES: hypothetical protein [unclassified Saccharopolyspora]|uniref:hypothetical protein n=1 Tax=unclassified Saccharopolyspora TaxID=2646250 RepID=UPI001CD5085C|nr:MULTISPECIES: hypothetical protein [unclassified Saccharopolyspora]MCA1187196.1 hypothetical protein [Saccharopolyspora sp. 6T]MCA1194318.1 hypothetical protein [Saccharopolyspora sp. 6V]MCA1282711.1 hypothetical protein [Saccharopolyspora sp. 7B]